MTAQVDQSSTSRLRVPLATFGAAFVALSLANALLQQHGAGILKFEFSFAAHTGQRILDDWGPEGRRLAALVNGLDFALIAAYVWLGRRLTAQTALGGRLVVAAGCLDLLQNVILFFELARGASPWTPVSAALAGCSTLACLIVALLLALLARGQPPG